MTKDELSYYLDLIERTVGTNWLHHQVEVIRGTDPRHVLGALMEGSDIHPLALAWFNSREELTMSELTGKSVFSLNTLNLTGIAKNIQTVSSFSGFPAQKNRLLDQSLYSKALYEISIAAGYSRMGQRVTFTGSGLSILHPQTEIYADCFPSNVSTAADLPGFCVTAENIISKAVVNSSPVIVYMELTDSLYTAVVNSVDRLTALLEGGNYNALVLSCLIKSNADSGLKLEEKGFVIMNPSPPINLPDSFYIYSPGDTSSISWL